MFYVHCSCAGDVIETERDIIVENVPIITPNGDVVVNKLNLQVRPLLCVTSLGSYGK